MRGIDATPRGLELTDDNGAHAVLGTMEGDKSHAFFTTSFFLTPENYHVMEYVLNNMVGLEQTDRMAFKDRATEAMK